MVAPTFRTYLSANRSYLTDQACSHGAVRRLCGLAANDSRRPTGAWLQHPMITAPMLEIAVLVLGMVILMVEAFATKIDKRILAFAAIVGLAIVLLASFFVAPFPSPNQATRFLEFLHRGPPVDLFQAIRAADHNLCADHDDRLCARSAQLLFLALHHRRVWANFSRSQFSRASG